MDLQELLDQIWPGWEIVDKIGEGSFGVVYEARRQDLSGVTRSAIKAVVIPRSESELDALYSEGMGPSQTHTYLENIVKDYSREIRLMESVKGHSNIVSIEDHAICEHKDKTAWHIFIRMELLTPLTKYVALNGISEKGIVKLGMDMCRALSVCADRHIIHRDIKPENIFINEMGNYKLGDFGVARKLEQTTMGFTRTGALNYMAQEVYNDAIGDMNFEDASRADIYSLGLVMYCLANGSRLPFLPQGKTILSLEDRKNAFARRIHGDALPPPTGQISERLCRIILKACAYDPKGRYSSVREMLQALEELERSPTASVTPAVNNDAQSCDNRSKQDVSEEQKGDSRKKPGKCCCWRSCR